MPRVIRDATPNLTAALLCATPAVSGHPIRGSGVRERRKRPAANNRRGLVNQFIVLDCRDHKQGKIHAARDVATQDGVTQVPAPEGQALTLAFFEIVFLLFDDTEKRALYGMGCRRTCSTICTMAPTAVSGCSIIMR